MIQQFQEKVNGKVFLLSEDFQSTIFQQWMERHKMDFVIIRPDRYIYDAGKMLEVEKVLTSLVNQLN